VPHGGGGRGDRKSVDADGGRATGWSVQPNAVNGAVEHTVAVDAHYTLWVEERGDPDRTPVLLVMGADASGATWPDALVDRLAARHRVVRYDHRDTGRSTRAFDAHPYAIRDLAEDAVAVLDALGIDRAHVVGMSMGGTLVQLLLVDHPERLRGATVFTTSALGAGLADPDGTGPPLPGPDPRLLAMWAEMGAEREPEEELAWRVAHWRLLAGGVLPFDPGEHSALEERVMAHSGTTASPSAHALADQAGLDRDPAALAAVTVPTLVLEAPEDPVNPPPHATHLAGTIGSARLVTVPGMGHALPGAVVPLLAEAILAHAAEADART
jgi:pimeloyl-ACP methyl ester carboxylesterase